VYLQQNKEQQKLHNQDNLKKLELNLKIHFLKHRFDQLQSSVAILYTTSDTVSPVHKLIQGMSGPCQITQLLEIGLQGLLSKFNGFILFLLYNIQNIIKNYKS
jgi:hypothetical protein